MRYKLILTMTAALLLASCSMMKDDRGDCPDCRNPLRVTLRYDYNTARADMFADHVEEATVYVVNPSTGNVVATQTAQNTAASQPLRYPSFAFNFEGLDVGNYRLYATARSAASQGFDVTEPKTGQSISNLKFAMPYNANGDVPAMRLDTLWNTLTPVDATVTEDDPTDATVGLMRLTNDLNVMVMRGDTLPNSHTLYDVTIADSHAALDYGNNPVAADSRLMTYKPFASWTTETVDSTGTAYAKRAGDDVTRAAVTGRVAHYDFSLFRLVKEEDGSDDAQLTIRNAADGTHIADIDLCYYLALARNYYQYTMPVQEYLDREYDYHIAFTVENRNGKDTWTTMTINIMSWAIRIQNEEL